MSSGGAAVFGRPLFSEAAHLYRNKRYASGLENCGGTIRNMRRNGMDQMSFQRMFLCGFQRMFFTGFPESR